MKFNLKAVYRRLGVSVKGLLSSHFKKKSLQKIISKGNFYDFPVYIISYNQLRYLKNTILWLRSYGYKNITVIDNHSDYEPLLSYYSDCGCKVIRMKKNYGHKVFYTHPRFIFKRNFCYYCLTDPDLKPISECPANFVELFFRVMEKYPDVSKVGFSLKIDDIPDGYEKKKDVICWESQYYSDAINSEDVCPLYYANLDTTFSLHSPAIFTPSLEHYFKGIRTGAPYQVRHLPWYDTEINGEKRQYLDAARDGINHW